MRHINLHNSGERKKKEKKNAVLFLIFSQKKRACLVSGVGHLGFANLVTHLLALSSSEQCPCIVLAQRICGEAKLFKNW